MSLFRLSPEQVETMGGYNLFMKDVREHGFALIGLGLGFFVVVLVVLEQQRSGVFSMSGFEVVRFSLITVIPLITFIVGNRLIVREYVGGTRRFVESLPINRFTPLFVKYFIGLVFVVSLALLMVWFTASTASAAENITPRYLQLLLLKTGVIALLYWSVVFFVSFTGRIRLVIYVIMGLTLMYFTNMPSFDETRFAPMALMERTLFVFERDILPVQDLIETALLAAAFVIAGFALALFNEGSIAEQLGKPISKRDMAAFVLLGMGCLTVYTTLQKKWETETYELSGEYVLRSEVPMLAVSYIDNAHESQAQTVLDSLKTTVETFKTDIGLDRVPQVQIALNTELEPNEIEPELIDGILVTANFIDYDSYEVAQLNAVAMHHLLLSLTNRRWDFESRHWILDGLSRWWIEGADQAKNSSNNDELIARALVAKRRFYLQKNPLLEWQTTSDLHGFEGADALSYSALLYLQELQGTQTVLRLAAEYINEDVGSSSIESVQRVLESDEKRFKQITGVDIDTFTDDWKRWLEQYEADNDIAALLASVPKITGKVTSVIDESGVVRLEGQYRAMEGYDGGGDGLCVLRHQLASAFDVETSIYERNRDKQNCEVTGIAHSVESPFAPGDRVYAVLEFETDGFHRPLIMWSGRLHVK